MSTTSCCPRFTGVSRLLASGSPAPWSVLFPTGVGGGGPSNNGGCSRSASLPWLAPSGRYTPP
eukprot:4145889-Alexandrium_andersonii.AAC.1